ncbi:hypothetical protein FRC11_014146 [Ceratobasidium sp. 423]|nr:hypothetical protein FRC11_014146 [Ceratobasidium sp. 423]
MPNFSPDLTAKHPSKRPRLETDANSDVQSSTEAMESRFPHGNAFTEPSLPGVKYPEGFQGNEIPVHGPFIAKLIEERIDGVTIKS